jgi:hypothetical protein
MVRGDQGFLINQVLRISLIVLLVIYFGACGFADSDSKVIVPDTKIDGSISSTVLETYLTGLPDVLFTRLSVNENREARYQLKVRQPLDHSDAKGGYFYQKVILEHKSSERPLIMITEGYDAGRNYVAELAHLLDANQLQIEHRFFGESQPDSLYWEFLSAWQAAQDHHRIVELLRPFYSGSWINTGWSKGGQTALFHRYFYPDDVVATVAYETPVNLDLEDPRIDRFFLEVESENCRTKLANFQRVALERKDRLIPIFKQITGEYDYKYSIGYEVAIEYVVLEYPFSFWQYHKINCMDIPDRTAPDSVIFSHLDEVVSLWSYSDANMNSVAAYQFATELGYYGNVQSHLSDLLSDSGYSNMIYAPKYEFLEFDPRLMEDVNSWLESEGNRILYIYGGNDPWSAAHVKIDPEVDAVTEFLEGGNHYTFIESFSEDKQKEILSIINEWLNDEQFE